MVNLENEVDFESDFDLLEVANSVADTVLKGEECPKGCEVELLITDEDTVKDINSQYRNIDKTTDVLSFPNVDWDSPADYNSASFKDEYLLSPENGLLMLGQIVLNDSRIISQANDYGHSVKREYAFLIAHSMLHLLGYDHMEDDEREVMEEKQREYLLKLGIER